jgi:hypothetical protein
LVQDHRDSRRDPAEGSRDRLRGAGPDDDRDLFVFPRWTNILRAASAVLVVGGLLYLVVFTYVLIDPRTTAVGYAPEQPVPYSHALHVGELGMDCRYCHNTVEVAAHAAIPPTQTCMNCHAHIRADSPKLLPIRESHANGLPVPWVRVHDLPDFVYFDHSAHLRAGVGCVSCHGRVDKMTVVQQVQPLSMGWCLECHRAPEKFLRPQEQLTAMDWVPDEDPVELGRRLRRLHDINPSTDCSTCHR